MKKILIVFACTLFLYGCGSSDDNSNLANSTETEVLNSNIEISLGINKWGMDLPKTWEKLPAQPEKGIVFLAREGSQNLVISHEKGFSENLVETLLKTTKSSLSMVKEISQTMDTLNFRGKLSATTPMREFYQKVLPGPNQEKFLLVSCSQEVANLENLNCPEILDSIYSVAEAE